MFSNVIGQEHSKSILRSMVNSDRIPHAMLITGKEGFGGLALALAYIQYILCEERNPEDACGRCKSCIKTQKLMHPDVHYSYPIFGKHISTDFLPEWRREIAVNRYMNVQHWLNSITGEESKQGNINKDECVSIVKKLSLKSFEAPNKILLLWLPEYLEKEGNILLKLIEEPPDNTIFVLVAENQEAVLATIRSRCQLIVLPPINENEIRDALVSRFSLPQRDAESISFVAEGNFAEAVLLSQHTENDNTALFLDWMRKCYGGNGVDVVSISEKIASANKEAQKFFLRYGLYFMRELAMLNAGVPTQKIKLYADALESALKMTKIIGMGQVEPISKLFNDGIQAIERNGSSKIIFVDISINLHKIMRQTNR